MGLLVKIKNLLILIRIFYWDALKVGVRSFLHSRDLRKAHEFWSEDLVRYFDVKISRLSNSQPVSNVKTLFLANHRSQGDFFLHSHMLNHDVNVLARMMVAVVFFITGFVSRHTVWYFNRSKVIDPEKFNTWLDERFLRSPKKSLLVYPEGHRMGATTSVTKSQIKTGMIKYAYRRQLPLQILMSFGNEKVFNEKKLHLSWGQTVVYGVSEIIDSKQFAEESEFVRVVSEKFIAFFDQVRGKYDETIASALEGKSK